MSIIASSCSAACLARLFHHRHGRVRALARLKVIKRLRRGEYDLMASTQGYVAYLRAQPPHQNPRVPPKASPGESLALVIRRMAQSIRYAKLKEPLC